MQVVEGKYVAEEEESGESFSWGSRSVCMGTRKGAQSVCYCECMCMCGKFVGEVVSGGKLLHGNYDEGERERVFWVRE